MTHYLVSAWVPSLLLMNMVSLPLPELPIPAAEPGFHPETFQTVSFDTEDSGMKKEMREMLASFKAVKYVMRSA